MNIPETVNSEALETEKLLDEYRQRIGEAIAQEKSRLKEGAERESRNIIAQAYEEAAGLTANARQEAEQIVAQAREQAAAQANNTVAEAEQKAQHVKNHYL